LGWETNAGGVHALAGAAVEIGHLGHKSMQLTQTPSLDALIDTY
jgi:hypothetical protein